MAANDRVSSVSGYMCCASLFSGILFFSDTSSKGKGAGSILACHAAAISSRDGISTVLHKYCFRPHCVTLRSPDQKV